MKRHKPRVLKLTPKSEGAVERMAATLAFMDLPFWSDDKPCRDRYRMKAAQMLEHLAKAAR